MQITRRFWSLKTIFAMTAVLALIILSQPVRAADITQPEEFYGSIRINGLAAPSGTVITAKINGVQRGKFTTTQAGQFGGSGTFDARLVVAGQADDAGDTISFWANGRAALQNALFESGLSKAVDLDFQKFPLKATDSQIVQALDYLRQAQSGDGKIDSYVTSTWAVMAITAAGQNPESWKAGGQSLIDYLANQASENLEDDKATDWERSILAIVAANHSPYDFGSIDYIARVKAFYDGTQMGDPDLLNDDVWGILALKTVSPVTAMISNMALYLIDHQNSDGGWGWGIGVESDVDNTAATISALLAAGESQDSEAITTAVAYLQSQQQSNGGFYSQGTTNAGVDAWAIRAISDLGQSPLDEAWQVGQKNPLIHLLSLQDTDGSFKWTSSQKSKPEWMTSYALISLLPARWPADSAAPVIGLLSPASGSTSSGASKTISAVISDAISGIDVDNSQMLLDGIAVEAQVTTSKISYAASKLSIGSHTVKITISDRAGNSTEKEWSFKLTKANSGGGGGGGGGSGSGSSPTTTTTPAPVPTGAVAEVKTLPPGTTSVAELLDAGGRFKDSLTLHSADQLCQLEIPGGAHGSTADNRTLDLITIDALLPAPAVAVNTCLIGGAYQLGPAGAAFDLHPALSLFYNSKSLPAGSNPEDLVIASWNAASRTWSELDSRVDSLNQSVRAEVSLLGVYGILAHVSPARFTVSGLTISEEQVQPDQKITIEAQVRNQGDLKGAFKADLEIDGQVVSSQTLDLNGKTSGSLKFEFQSSLEGLHKVELYGLAGEFSVIRVKTPAALKIKSVTSDKNNYACGETIKVRAVVNNGGQMAGSQKLTLKVNNQVVESRTINLEGGAEQSFDFSFSRDVPGNYQALINDVPLAITIATATPQTPAEKPPAGFNWLVLGIGAVALLVVLSAVLLVVRRKKSA
jgi:hypothetical protein